MAATAAWSLPASAWIEQNPKGLLSVVEVEADGHATVSHELVLEVRGGPLKSLELGTSDPDAEILPDATVTRAAGGVPIPLLVERHADGSLRLEVDLPKGLRGGTWLFKVRYRTNLAARDRLRARAGAVEIGWVGPRLDAGVDGVRAIFRLPPSDTAPRLPSVDKDDPDPGFGVMVSSMHHTPQADEIELVRSHVARGEPVLWRVETSALSPSTPGAAAEAPKPALATPSVPLAAPARSLRWPLISGLFAVALALLVFFKERSIRAGGAVPRALVPLPTWARVPLSGLSLGGALLLGNELEEPLVS
ncbi:MAG TPA: hypothetical protein VFV94_07185, partial [Polyangiaceae bacterium]|nr:hypothetical protein [Polyangiaceae bacterium]